MPGDVAPALPRALWSALVDEAGRPFDALHRVYDALASAAPGDVPAHAALYRWTGEAFERHRSTDVTAPTVIAGPTEFRQALAACEHAASDGELPDGDAGADALRRAGFDRVLAAWEGDDLDGVLVFGERSLDADERAAAVRVGALALHAARLRRERDRLAERLRTADAIDEVAAARGVEEFAFLAVHKVPGVVDHHVAAFVVVHAGRARLVALSGHETVSGRDEGARRLEAVALAAEGRSATLAVLDAAGTAAASAALDRSGLSLLDAGAGAVGDDRLAGAAHADLLATSRGALAIIPLRVGSDVRAVLVLGGPAELLHGHVAVECLAAYGKGLETGLGRLLDLRDIPLVRLLEPLRPLARSVSGTRRGTAVALACVAAVAGLGAIWPRDLVVEGPSMTVARERVAVRSPRDGVLASVVASSGTRVEAGQVLAAVAPERLEEAAIPVVAPMAGILSGRDLAERLGDEVRAGERLAIVERADRPLVEMQLEELDLPVVQRGARAEVRLAGERSTPLRGRVVEIRSLRGSPGEARFVAVVETDGVVADRPGLPGRARIYCGRRSFWGVVLRPLVTAVRQRLWL